MTGFVLTIAGVDPSGASGVIADARAMSALGARPACVVTATTAQGMTRFWAPHPVAPDVVAAQLAALRTDTSSPRAIKLGMLGSAEAARVVAAHLEAAAPEAFVVVDPVLRSSSGGALADAGVPAVYRDRIVRRADLVTPNLPEAALVLGRPVRSLADMDAAAQELLELGAKAVLVKGGHLEGAEHTATPLALDRYRDRTGRAFWLAAPRLPQGARGTGCVLSAAVAAAVALGQDPVDALVMARAYVQRGLRLATDAVLVHAPWPVSAVDFPWLAPELGDVSARLAFPPTGPRPLGFYPIVDRAAWLPRLAPLGVDLIQLRIKDLRGEELATEVASAVDYARRHDLRLFVNDYWQLALALGAYGVHLGQEDLETADLRAVAAGGLRLGVSTHSYAELARAAALHPSYVALGPIHETTCKSMRFGPHGPARIAEWRALTTAPLVAIGGLRCEEARTLKALGADGLAVVSDVVRAASPEARACQWLGELR
jgi:hydroxymethylpyrimidine kinase/phosphomethylpyrimidine kinase/thiamine-phosphate diphosphorylase